MKTTACFGDKLSQMFEAGVSHKTCTDKEGETSPKWKTRIGKAILSPNFFEGVLSYFKIIDFAMPNIQSGFKLTHNFVSYLETLVITTDVAGM